MARKLRIVWLALTILVVSSVSGIADEVNQDKVNIKCDFFLKNISINGTEINNYNLQYPFVTASNTLYMPLTEAVCSLVGIEAEMDTASRTLKIKKTKPAAAQISDSERTNGEPLVMQLVEVDSVKLYGEGFDGGLNNLLSTINELAGSIAANDALSLVSEKYEKFDASGIKVLKRGKYYYLPVRFLSDAQVFSWDVAFDPYWGMAISSEEGKAAEEYVKQEEALYLYRLANYIMNENKGISPAVAQEYVFHFERAGEIYGVDPKLVMAVADKESHFTALAGADKENAPKGIMQIMPDTGMRMGLTVEQLLDPKTSITVGAQIIAGHTEAMGGDYRMGLTAYNYGMGNVKRGNYTTKYANGVLDEYYEIVAYAMG